ncbi:MAG: hypothetical protein AB7U45_12490 [Desulfamplus sp.]
MAICDSDQQLRRTFAMWLSRLLRSRLKNDNIPEFQELKEVDSMLAETITEWTEQWMAEGEAKGENQLYALYQKNH